MQQSFQYYCNQNIKKASRKSMFLSISIRIKPVWSNFIGRQVSYWNLSVHILSVP